jgi:hypothetical protein
MPYRNQGKRRGQNKQFLRKVIKERRATLK